MKKNEKQYKNNANVNIRLNVLIDSAIRLI